MCKFAFNFVRIFRFQLIDYDDLCLRKYYIYNLFTKDSSLTKHIVLSLEFNIKWHIQTTGSIRQDCILTYTLLIYILQGELNKKLTYSLMDKYVALRKILGDREIFPLFSCWLCAALPSARAKSPFRLPKYQIVINSIRRGSRCACSK